MPLRYIDPNRPITKLTRALNDFARSRVGQNIARHVASKTDPWLGRLSNGPVSWGMFSVPSATLKMMERRSVEI